MLFLGAGACVGATDDKGEKIPLGGDLKKMLISKFLDDSYKDESLSHVAEVASSERSIPHVQSYIKSVFEKIKPAEYHLLIPTFLWKYIFTTNYDLIIEDSYRQVGNISLQEVNPIIRNTISEEIFRNEKTLPYYKLHGCISNISDEGLPLIITPDQYILYKKNRERLFAKLEELAYDHTFLFVGFSFGDSDIRSILNRLDSVSDSRPRWYMIGPHIKDAEINMYQKKKITPLKCSFEDFLKAIDSQIKYDVRKLYKTVSSNGSNPLFKYLKIDATTVKPTESLIDYFTDHIDILHPAITSDKSNPKDFYKGYFTSWNPIIQNFDVRRSISDSIISEAFLKEDNYRPHPELYVILGHAGSGKSVLLRRLAFEAALSFDKPCFYLKAGSSLSYEAFVELYNLLKTRLYIFIDAGVENSEAIETFYRYAKKDAIQVTIITTARLNEWSTECENLKLLVESSFELQYLNDKEIREFISLLERHHSLGYLESLDYDQRITEFKERAGRQLLVALLEATSGVPFVNIIKNEYDSINNTNAKLLYLTVSILHRLDAPARAGLISRVHGVSFKDFESQLFRPLTHIVFAREDYLIRDYVYETRHRQIADKIFETVLTSEQDRYDEYLRILSNLNVDYESDRTAFISMINARNLLELFSDPLKIRRIYDIAEKASPDDPKLMQQEAIFELKRSNPNRKKAEEYLSKALSIVPNDSYISHTLAELNLENAIATSNKLAKFKLLDLVEDICNRIIKKRAGNTPPYHTKLKAKLHQLEYVLKFEEGPTIERLMKEIEKEFNIAKQLFPNEALILAEEAKLNDILNNEPQVLEALRKAYKANPASPYICLRLSNIYENAGDIRQAILTCTETLKYSPNEKDIYFRLGMLLLQTETPNLVDIKHYFRKAFIIGDSRYDAQFWYGRTCFLLKDFDEANTTFENLSQANMSYEIKMKPKAFIKQGKHNMVFMGVIIRLEYNYGIIRRDEDGKSIFFLRLTEKDIWSSLAYYKKVAFHIGFNFRGALSTNLSPLT